MQQSLKITNGICLLLMNCLWSLIQKKKAVHLYWHFLGIVNLDKRIMTQNYNAIDGLKCHLWSEDPNRCEVILIVQHTFSSLALIACMITAIFIIILRKYKSTTERLIFWLSVSSVLRSLVLLLTDHDDRNCRVKRFFYNYFSCTSLLWVFMIAVNCLLIVKRKKS